MLKEGDVIELKDGEKVMATVPKHLVYSNKQGDFSLCRSIVTIGGTFSYLAGRYVVTKTSFDGGGTGHGPHDVYADGHHVFCENIVNGAQVEFYQSGSFEHTIYGIEPIGRAKRSWVLE